MKRFARTICLLALCLALALPAAALGSGARRKTVRVGWYESGYCYRDKNGKRNGIAYEYQRRIAAHTGWIYEYVEDSWPNLLQMLIAGEIDLLSDVSFTQERTELMLFSALPMGSEAYYAYIDADNDQISMNDLTTFNGKRVGVNKGSFQYGLMEDWARKNGLTPTLVEIEVGESESMAMLESDELDAYVALGSFGAQEMVIPVCRIGASDYYFAVNKNRPDLLDELNSAMTAIQDEDPYYNQRLFDQFVKLVKTNAFLSRNLEQWIKEHGAIRVGYWDDYLPFCGVDKTTGELTGALKDFLAHAANCLRNASLTFESVPYPSRDAALAAMREGKVDCVFPVNLSLHDGEVMGILATNSVMETEMSVLMRANERPEITPGKNLNVAIDVGNTNFETFIYEAIPDWTIQFYPTVEDCFRAVDSGKADAVLAGNYRMNAYEPLRTKYKLLALPTGETMEFSFAASEDSPELYSILNKIATLSPSGDMDYALVEYMYSGRKVSVMDFLEDHWLGVLALMAAVFAGVLFLLKKKLNAERKVNEQGRQIEEALRRELSQREQLASVTKIAYTDPLTGVKSKNAYQEDEKKLDRRIANGSVTAFAFVLFDLNDLKEVNDTLGHDAGDEYIREGCDIICSRFKRSPVYRVGGDEFVALLEGEDYILRHELLRAFERQMDVNLRSARINIASGCADFDPAVDRSAHDVLERADANMYRRKKQMKEQ